MDFVGKAAQLIEGQIELMFILQTNFNNALAANDFQRASAIASMLETAFKTLDEGIRGLMAIDIDALKQKLSSAGAGVSESEVDALRQQVTQGSSDITELKSQFAELSVQVGDVTSAIVSLNDAAKTSSADVPKALK